MIPTPMTRKFTKDDGFVPIDAPQAAMGGKSFESIRVGLLDEFGLPHSPTQIDRAGTRTYPSYQGVDDEGKGGG